MTRIEALEEVAKAAKNLEYWIQIAPEFNAPAFLVMRLRELFKALALIEASEADQVIEEWAEGENSTRAGIALAELAARQTENPTRAERLRPVFTELLEFARPTREDPTND